MQSDELKQLASHGRLTYFSGSADRERVLNDTFKAFRGFSSKYEVVEETRTG